MSDTVTMSKSDLSALIAAEVAKAVRAARGPSPFKFVVTRDIPKAGGGKWATIEVSSEPFTVIEDDKTVVKYAKTEKYFLDHTHDAGQRRDKATETVMYASPMRK